VGLLDDPEENVLAYITFVNDKWTKSNSINVIERPNGEIKGCTDVSRILTSLPFKSPPKPPSCALLDYPAETKRRTEGGLHSVSRWVEPWASVEEHNSSQTRVRKAHPRIIKCGVHNPGTGGHSYE